VKTQRRAPAPARIWLRRCAWGFALGCVPLVVPLAAAEQRPEGADDCVRFENLVGDKQMTVRVQNSCDVKLSCHLTYRLRCSATSGSQTSSETKAEAFKLARKGSHELALSAEVCKQSWDIDQIQWTCS